MSGVFCFCWPVFPPLFQTCQVFRLFPFFAFSMIIALLCILNPFHVCHVSEMFVFPWLSSVTKYVGSSVVVFSTVSSVHVLSIVSVLYIYRLFKFLQICSFVFVLRFCFSCRISVFRNFQVVLVCCFCVFPVLQFSLFYVFPIFCVFSCFS